MESVTNENISSGRRYVAWACTAILIISTFGEDHGLQIWMHHSPWFDSWIRHHLYPARLALKMFRAVFWVAVAYVFSGLRSARLFLENVRLNQKPTMGGWWCAWLAIAIALVDQYLGAKGLLSPNPVGHSFYRNGGAPLLLFVSYVVSVGPLYEEVVFRGFLYGEFRISYGPLRATFLILCITAYFHWDAVTGSFWTPCCLGLLWILLCGLRERTGNVWNCVICHAAYNCAQVFTWPIFVMAPFLLLPFCGGTGGGGVKSTEPRATPPHESAHNLTLSAPLDNADKRVFH